MFSIKVMNAMSNFEQEGEMGTYVSAEDSDFYPGDDDLSDAVSMLSMNDNASSYGSDLTSFQSVFAGRSCAARDNKASSSKGRGMYYGSSTMMLPYVVNTWDDSMGRGRISAQVHAPSGIDIQKKLKHRISKSQRELVLSFPISPFLSRSDFAFFEVTKINGAFKGMSKQQIDFFLENHPRTAARVKSVGILKGRNTTKEFLYSQRIPLPKQARHAPITQTEDPVFHGIKFAVNKDGSTFMFAELMVHTNDSYCPEERLLNASMFRNETAASLSQGVILNTIPEDATMRKTKRSRDLGCDIADGNEDDMSTSSSYVASSFQSPPMLRMPQMQQAFMMQKKAEQDSLMQAFAAQQALAQQQAFELTQTAFQKHQQGDLDMKPPALSQAKNAQQEAEMPQGDQALHGAGTMASLQRNDALKLDQTPQASSNNNGSAVSPALQHHAEEIMRSIDAEMKNK